MQISPYTLNEIPIIRLGILALTLFIPAQAVQADIYKWTDENGHVFYGDKPTGKNPQKIAIQQEPSLNKADKNRFRQRQHLLEVMDEERQAREKDREDNRLAQEKRRGRCKLAKNNLNEILTSSYLFEKTDDPMNPRIFSEDERDATTRKARNDVDKWCS